MTSRLACWFLTAWLGVFGAVVGSFLNVVIYRLPLGMSLSFPGSLSGLQASDPLVRQCANPRLVVAERALPRLPHADLAAIR